MNSVTLGLLFTTTQIGIFSTQFKAFETEFTAKTSLITFLTIYMALSQILTQVGKDPYLLELSELHLIGAHALPSPRKVTLLLAPSRIDDPNDQKSREKELLLSLKIKIPAHCITSSTLPFLCFKLGKKSIHQFCLIIIYNSNNSHHVPSFDF